MVNFKLCLILIVILIFVSITAVSAEELVNDSVNGDNNINYYVDNSNNLNSNNLNSNNINSNNLNSNNLNSNNINSFESRFNDSSNLSTNFQNNKITNFKDKNSLKNGNISILNSSDDFNDSNISSDFSVSNGYELDKISVYSQNNGFNDLSDLINDAILKGTNEVNLTQDYVYSLNHDSNDFIKINASKDIVINGNNHSIDGIATEIHSSYMVKIFDIISNRITVKFNDIVFKRAFNSAIYTRYGNVIYVNNCSFESNLNSFGQAALCSMSRYARLFVINSKFFNNYVEGKIAHTYGGGAICSFADTIIDNCTFINNTGKCGGAIFSANYLIIKNSVFINNTAFDYGGAIYFSPDYHNYKYNFAMDYSVLINNTAADFNAVYLINNVDFSGKTNYWGTNSPNMQNLINIDLDSWIILNLIGPNLVKVNNTVNYLIDLNTFNNGSKLSEDLPKFGINIYVNNGILSSENISVDGLTNFTYLPLSKGNFTIILSYNLTSLTGIIKGIDTFIDCENISIFVDDTFKLNINSSSPINQGKLNLLFNGSIIGSFDVINNSAILNFNKLFAGNYKLNLSYTDDDLFENSCSSVNLVINKISTSIATDYISTFANSKILVKVICSEGLVNGGVIKLVRDSNVLTAEVEKGYATFFISDLAAGKYVVNISYEGSYKFSNSMKQAILELKNSGPYNPDPVVPTDPNPNPVVPIGPSPVIPINPDPMDPGILTPVVPTDPNPDPVVPIGPSPVVPINPNPNPNPGGNNLGFDDCSGGDGTSTSNPTNGENGGNVGDEISTLDFFGFNTGSNSEGSSQSNKDNSQYGLDMNSGDLVSNIRFDSMMGSSSSSGSSAVGTDQSNSNNDWYPNKGSGSSSDSKKYYNLDNTKKNISTNNLNIIVLSMAVLIAFLLLVLGYKKRDKKLE